MFTLTIDERIAKLGTFSDDKGGRVVRASSRGVRDGRALALLTGSVKCHVRVA